MSTNSSLRPQNPLDSSCQYVKGVGPKRALFFKRMGIETVSDLFYLYPRRYEDRRTFISIRKLRIGEFQTLQGRVVASGTKETRSRLKLFQLAVEDDTGVLFATWFNQPYLKKIFEVGQKIILSGKVQWYGRDLQIMNPDYEILAGDASDLLHTGRIVPIYPLTEGLSQRVLRGIVKNAFDQYEKAIEEFLPRDVLNRYRLMDLKKALYSVHFPENLEIVPQIRHRLAFEEFLILELGMEIKRRSYQRIRRPFPYVKLDEFAAEFIEGLPFLLTGAQKKCIAEIIQDFKKDSPMNRLLQGDVGSGKTLVACCALFLAVRNGYQGALMVPTEVLAEQHYQTLQKFFSKYSVEIGWLVGNEKRNIKEQILRDLQDGKIQILVGTHALLEENVRFQKLSFIVIDEQHKFGVAQRAVLRGKGLDPDVLIMTATPIPRTLSMTLYGDLEISILDEMPPGRGEIATYWIRKNKLNDAYRFIEKEIGQGGQAFIIYPLVEESEKKALKAATKMFNRLTQETFKGLRLGLVHGRMDAADKNEVLYQFRDRKIDVLVSTTVIEVGIDIPNASIILIENADAFGLAQLHQLRGRIGRGSRKSYCILEGDPNTEEGLKRLKTMSETHDGFKIAEADLSIRGPGEFLGTRQHGLPDIHFGNLITDLELIKLAKKAAGEILDQDPFLGLAENRKIRQTIRRKFSDRSEYFSVG